MHEDDQGEASELPGHGSGGLQVLDLGCQAGEEEDLGGLLVGRLGRRDCRGLAVEVRLAVETQEVTYSLS